MKKVLMLALMVLATSALVNAQTAPEKKTEVKEVKMGKHEKHAKKHTKKETNKVDTKMEETKKAEPAKKHE